MAINNNKKLSIFVERMVPQFIVDDHPAFVDFFRGYFEFLEQENNPFEIINKLLYDRNIDNSIGTFFEEYRTTFAADFPKQNRADLTLVIKNIREYYSQKGNEDSFGFLFRTIYDEPIEFYYPKVDILRCSDGKWFKPTHIVIKKPDDTFPDYAWLKANFLSQSVVALQSGDVGFINGFIQTDSPEEINTTVNPTQVWAAEITGSVGAFIEGENIRIREDEGGAQALIATSITDGFLSIEELPGRWIGTDGFLSSNKYLQDNFYYQEHSYQVRVAMSSNFYWRTIRKNVHPAGTIFFGVVDFLDGILSSMEAMSASYLNNTVEHGIVSSAEVLVDTIYNEQSFEYNIQTGGSASWSTYSFIERMRELQPYASLYLAGAFDYLPINTFDLKAGVGFPYGQQADIVIG